MRDELRDARPGTLTIIDEVQKVPALLDEVHWLIENQGLVFGFCGSSARKVRRGHANLLGGRAVRFELFGLVAAELGADADVVRMANLGYLPRHYLADDPRRLLRAYVADYLKEEIAAEGHVRNLPAFARFLRAAALADTELVNFTNIARECGVSLNAVKEYYQIPVDTLSGRFVPAYTRRPKRRVIQAPKFYFWELAYWRLASGIEVDFVLDGGETAIEVKSAERVGDQHLKGLRAIREDHPRLRRRILVCREPKRRLTSDGIEIFPVHVFLTQLWDNAIG